MMKIVTLVLLMLVGLMGCVPAVPVQPIITYTPANISASAPVTEPTDYALNVTVSPSGSGTVTLSPPGGKYVQGTKVILNPTPASGYVFAGWTNERGEIYGGNPLTVIMGNANVKIIVIFDNRGVYNPP